MIDVKLLSGALGAEISGIDLTDVSDENFKKINNLLLEHKVIFFSKSTFDFRTTCCFSFKIWTIRNTCLCKRFKWIPGNSLKPFT